MSKIKQLAGETVLYGVSTVLSKLLNWLLMPLFVRTLSIEDNGYIIFFYSIIAIIQVVLTFGFETGFFRFVSVFPANKVFSTLLSFITAVGITLFISVLVFDDFFTIILNAGGLGNIIVLITAILIIDSISALPFALLRYYEKSLKYAFLRLIQVIIICISNWILLVTFPKHLSNSLLESINYNPLASVFISNLLGSVVVLIFLGKTIFSNITSISIDILKKVFHYSYPIWFVGIFGIFNQVGDKILLNKFLSGNDNYDVLGIYGNNFKLGVLMALFTQSFRLAFEPFFFKYNNSANIRNSYATIMNYFVAFGVLIFLGVLLYLPVINLVLTKEYLEGNIIIPYVLLGQLFFGIYYSLSLWYKLADKTYFGLLFTVIGSILGITGYFVLIPLIGYLGAAISGMIGYFVMMILSYFFGQKHYPVPYNLKRILSYFGIGLGLYFISIKLKMENTMLTLFINTLLISIFIGYFAIKEKLINHLKKQ